VSGAIAQIDGEEITVRSGSVVNATGVWLRDWTGAEAKTVTPNIRPAKGVHIVVPWLKIRNDCTVTIPVPGRARRATITRWRDTCYLGTTDEDYQGDLNDVKCTYEEMMFLLEGLQSALKVDLSVEDVLGSYAGLRPLVAPPGGKSVEVKRNHEIRTDHDGLVTVVGGKLTTSRHMAEQTVDEAQAVLGRRARCRTVDARLLGAAGYDAQATTATGGIAAHLGERYGTEAHFVSDIIANDPSLGRELVPGLPYLEAEVIYAARHEFARGVDDILARRTRARLQARDASSDAAPRVAALLKPELGWSDAETAAQIADYCQSVSHEREVLTGTAVKKVAAS
jgi:glycerol-3-phosphate dehydrogenase